MGGGGGGEFLVVLLCALLKSEWLFELSFLSFFCLLMFR